MSLFQSTALCMVFIYALHWFYQEKKPASFLIKFTAISAASWIAEETSIRAYHLYQYIPGWSFFIGHVPILVILVWPVVIHSGWELACQLTNHNKRDAHLVAALIIWIDASLIETIAVRSGLWSWNTAGIFGVPLIGIFGWVYFSLLSIRVLTSVGNRKADIAKTALLTICIACGTHAMLAATWWLIFRWLRFPMNTVFIAAAAWCASLAMIHVIHRKKPGIHVAMKTVLLRVPPAVFFFIMYLNGSPDNVHTAFILAFSLPYLFLMHRIRSAGRHRMHARHP